MLLKIRHMTSGPLHLLWKALPSESCMACSLTPFRSLIRYPLISRFLGPPSITMCLRSLALSMALPAPPHPCHPTYYVYYLPDERMTQNREAAHSWLPPPAEGSLLGPFSKLPSMLIPTSLNPEKKYSVGKIMQDDFSTEAPGSPLPLEKQACWQAQAEPGNLRVSSSQGAAKSNSTHRAPAASTVSFSFNSPAGLLLLRFANPPRPSPPCRAVGFPAPSHPF